LLELGLGRAVLVHDPGGAVASRRPASVEDERLLDADEGACSARADEAVLARGLPVAGGGRAVGAVAAGVLAVEGREEEPLGVVRPDEGLGGQLPGLAGGEIDVGDEEKVRVRASGDLGLEVVAYQLLVCWAEAEPDGQRLRRRRRRRRRHRFPRCAALAEDGLLCSASAGSLLGLSVQPVLVEGSYNLCKLVNQYYFKVY
jgi:hypothetical protein